MIIINVMLGTGLIFMYIHLFTKIVPSVFLLSGIGLSTIGIIMTAFCSYISFKLIIEALSICNALNFHEKTEKTSDDMDRPAL